MLGKKLLYGGDYNPEQWLDCPDILNKDIEYFIKAKINTVTLGVFAWSVLEPKEDEYHLEWLEAIINRLYKHGIHTILATPSGARPKWMSDKYPEVLRVDEDRRRQLFGGRHNHCYTSLVYRDKVRKINIALAKRFSNHPSVLMWHISNEFGGQCHCPACQKAFRKWLERRYESIDELNDKWCTTFWSHRYQSFQQIESPSAIGEAMVHALNLDWHRFVTDQTADFVKAEITALKGAGAAQPMTTNFMYNYKELNYDVIADTIDIISWDTYPLWHKEDDIKIANDTGFWHDYMRSLKGQPFILMESSPASTNWQGVSKLKKPGLLEAASLHAIAHGSDSVLYFQMRQSRGSSEKFHGAVIDHYGGDDTRVFKEVSKIGYGLKLIEEVVETKVNAKVAIVYDVENRWAIEDSQGPRNNGMYYYELMMKSYRALKRRALNVDIISEVKEMKQYELLVVPMAYMLREGFEKRLREYIAEGKTVVMTYFSGIVDQYDRCYLGRTPYHLKDVFGIRSMEVDALYNKEYNQFVPASDSKFSRVYECKYLCELVEVSGGKVLMQYGKDFYKNYPAVVQNSYGKGQTYYICADVEESFYDDLYSIIIEEKGIEPLISGSVPVGVEVNERSFEGSNYLFVQNFNNNIIDISEMKLKGDIFYGNSVIKLGAYGTLILKV